MGMSGQSRSKPSEFDAVIVGASLAGCTAAIKLGRAGARVALVERRPDPGAFKRVCSHLIQGSGVPTLERLGLLDAALELGAVRSHLRVWSRWGWVVAPPDAVPRALNLRRELLDPLLRAAALDAPGVEPLLGHRAERLLRDERDGRVRGVVVRARGGDLLPLRARLTIGADGRGSRIAALAGVPVRTTPHGRFAYGGYFAGEPPASAPDASAWFLDPQWAAAFPTDGGLTFYAAMPTKERLPEFRRDPRRALVAFVADLPDAPPIRSARPVGPLLGRLEMPNVRHEPVAPGLALVGDAALAIDPLWGVGCGWALQSAEWLCDEVGAALAAGPAADRELERGLRAYRRRWRAQLGPHARAIESAADGRRANAGERLVTAAAARDPRTAARLEAVGARVCSPLRAFAPGLPRAVAVNVRHALARRPRYAPYRGGAAEKPGAEREAGQGCARSTRRAGVEAVGG